MGLLCQIYTGLFFAFIACIFACLSIYRSHAEITHTQQQYSNRMCRVPQWMVEAGTVSIARGGRESCTCRAILHLGISCV
jgi:hypothetical protein